MLTASDFSNFCLEKHVGTYYFFILIGFACLNSGEKGKDFSRFLHSGNEVMKQLLHIIMKTAPVGLGAYFAYQVGGILTHSCLEHTQNH
jgi:Na+/H+-dicarboxylate symporter